MKHFAISATRDGFRRAGRAWSREAAIVAAEDLTDAQLEMLRADPNITVTPCAPPEDPEDAAAAPAAGPNRSPAEVARDMSRSELRAALIHVACRQIDPDNPDHVTKAGLPEIAELKRQTGLVDVSAGERDEAWLAVLAERETGA